MFGVRCSHVRRSSLLYSTKCSGVRFEFEDSELSDAVRTDVVLFIDHDLYE